MNLLTLVTIRLTEEQFKKIKELADELQMDVGELLEYALSFDMENLKLRAVLELLKQKKITVWKAAQILGISFREMEEIMKKYNIPYPISVESVLSEIKEIKSNK